MVRFSGRLGRVRVASSSSWTSGPPVLAFVEGTLASTHWNGSTLAVLSVLVAASSASAQQQQGLSLGSLPAPIVKENATVKIGPHSYAIPDGSVVLVPNVGIVVGSKATLVVDTGMGPRNGATVMREVAKVSKNTELYLVTTHFHAEHVAGISAFPPQTKYVISRVQQQDLDELGADLTKRFASGSPVMGELLQNAPVRKADILFDRDYKIDLGGVTARLLAAGPTHTRGDTMVFVEEDKVLYAGDV